jgi:hypothetical protein
MSASLATIKNIALGLPARQSLKPSIVYVGSTQFQPAIVTAFRPVVEEGNGSDVLETDK